MERVSQRHVIAQPHARRHGRRNHTSGTPRAAAPHVDQYFEALPAVWRDRTNEIAQEITMGLYPHALVEAATVERTDAVLNGDVDIPHGARRLLAEGRDGVLRALRCQQKDAE